MQLLCYANDYQVIAKDLMPNIFDPIRLGAIDAPNRIFMAPLTRTRGTRDHVPTEIMAQYYSQRASAGLIISEAIGVSRQGLGMPFATGLWHDDHVTGWRRITDAVHAAGGRIVAQIWHMGRMVHPSFADGAAPVSASATQAPGRAHTNDGRIPFVMARPLGLHEMPDVVADHRLAARNAMKAGFDGVQVHAANGYLIDQFLRDNTNLRGDDYGGTIENRMRLLIEITSAVCEEVGAERTSVRISPNGDSQGVNDSNPEPLFVAVAKRLDSFNLSFLDVREPSRVGTLWMADRDPIAPAIRASFNGPLVLNSDLTKTTAVEILASGLGDAVSFGRLFISNPDLPYRLAHDLPLAEFDRATSYTQGPAGYTDYPFASA